MLHPYTGQPVGLVVRSAFDQYSVGQHIIDEDVVDQILCSEHAHCVDKYLMDAYPQKEIASEITTKKKGDK